MTWYRNIAEMSGIVVDGAIRDSRGISENTIFLYSPEASPTKVRIKSGPRRKPPVIFKSADDSSTMEILIVGDYDGLVRNTSRSCRQIID